MMNTGADCVLICEWCPWSCTLHSPLRDTLLVWDSTSHYLCRRTLFKFLHISLFWSIFIKAIFWSFNFLLSIYSNIFTNETDGPDSLLCLIMLFLNWTLIKWPSDNNLVLHVTCPQEENASACWYECFCLMDRPLLNENIAILVYNISLWETD